MNTGNREFDYFAQRVLDASRPPEGADEAQWAQEVQRHLRMVFRAGSQARVAYEYGKLTDTGLARLTWLAQSGLLGKDGDLGYLLSEVQGWRDKADAFTGTYGMTEADLRSMVAEGFHTAFRKAVDHPYATVIHKLIRELPPEDWAAVLDFVVRPIVRQLREAQRAAEKKKEQPSES